MNYFSILVTLIFSCWSLSLYAKSNLQVDSLQIDAPIIYDIQEDNSLLSSMTVTNLGAQPLKAVHLRLTSQHPDIVIPRASFFVPQLAKGETYKHFFKLKLSDKPALALESCNKSGITLGFKESHRKTKAVGDIIKRAQGALEVWLSPKSKGLCSKMMPHLGLSQEMDLMGRAEKSLKLISYRSQYTQISDYWQVALLILFLIIGIYRFRKF